MEEMIACMVCGKQTKMITPKHLHLHGMSVAEYKERFPEAPIRSQAVIDKARESLDDMVERLGKKKSTRVKVACDPDDFVECMICQKRSKQITQLHLNIHGISMSEYKERFPDAALVNRAIRERIADEKRGRARGPETIRKMKESKANTYYPPETYRREFNEETRKKISEGVKKFWNDVKKESR